MATPPVVWMTTPACGTPHARALLAHNPGVSVHVSMGTDFSEKKARRLAWSAADRRIRDWWRANRHQILADSVVFLEWDVLFRESLAVIWPDPVAGLSGANLKTSSYLWSWYDGRDSLSAEMRPFACGIAPLAVVHLSREALDAIASPEFDALFDAGHYCELRLATLVAYCGFPVEWNPRLPHVHFWPMDPPATGRGVWHAVKHAA